MSLLKNSLKPNPKNTILGILFTIILGSFLHFLYDLTNKIVWIGIFCAVSESVWEHLKLLFVPFLIYFIVSCIFLKDKAKNFIISNVLGVIVGMLFIVVTFYLYSELLGHPLLPVDISLFILSCILSFLYRNYNIRKNYLSSSSAQIFGIILLIIILAFFIIFTFYPPNLPLFSKP